MLLNFSEYQVNLNNAAQIQQDWVAAAHPIGATILAQAAHPFELPGVSEVSIVLLAKFHASVHIYPEYHAWFIDLFTCGEQIQAKSFASYLQQCWQLKWTFINRCKNGLIPPSIQFKG